MDINSEVDLTEQELAIAAGFELSELTISIPLLNNKDLLTSDEAYETMSLRLGMGVDAIEEGRQPKN